MKRLMKKNKANHKTGGQAAMKSVRIQFEHVAAMTISIIGTFNHWRHDATPMTGVGEGSWFKELWLPPGVYEYQLLVDGRWIADPRAAKTAPNPFGEVNSVLKVS